MSLEFGDLTTQIAADGRISAEEILELRRDMAAILTADTVMDIFA